MTAKRAAKKTGARRKVTFKRLLSKAKAKLKKATRKKTSARSAREPKKAVSRRKPVVKKAKPKAKAKPKVKQKAKPKAKVKTKKTSARSVRAPKKLKKAVSRRKPVVKKAKPKVKVKAKVKLKVKPKVKVKAKKTPVRSARAPKKAVSRRKPAVKKAFFKPRAKLQKAPIKSRKIPKKPTKKPEAAAKKNSIENYQVVSVIGEGGMGKIYKAIDKRTKKVIVMKQLMIAEKEILIKRFKREADIMLSLNHKNIVTVYDYLKKGSSYHIIMEFVDGISLEDLIRKKGKIEPVRALLIFNEICKGLKYAHDRQIIHRDIKPNNVLISKTGVVKLVDFGIAKSLQEDDEALTKTGVIMGTPAYMSPEQLISTKYVDNLTDIYSMGVMFYQMVTGKKPYAGDFTAENLRKIILGDYVNPKQLNPTLPGYCMHIVKNTMHHKKDKRVKDLQELTHYMSGHLSQFKNQQQLNNEIKKALGNL